MKVNKFFTLSLLLTFFFAQGCTLKKRTTLSASVAPRRVPQLTDADTISKLIDGVNAAQADKQLQKRNDEINKIIIAVDNNYGDYKNALYAGRAGFDTFADFLSLALTGATAVTGTVGTKAALGAAATGVTGAHSSVNKNFFNDTSRDALFSVMDSLRSEELATIQEKMKKSVSDYDMSEALVDLERYYSLGTVVEARNAVTSAASTQTTPATGTQNPSTGTQPPPSTGPQNPPTTGTQTQPSTSTQPSSTGTQNPPTANQPPPSTQNPTATTPNQPTC
ncbi:MAG: hypothetical protein ACRD4F_17540, partial [Candidatus Angelobacter sp.]